MQKILKLSAVSMLAIMTASGANAAGYTCEELIEYTSCNPGYYLNTSGGTCSEGSIYITGVCDWTQSYDNVRWNMTEAECYQEESSATYRPEACLAYDVLDEETSWAEGVTLSEPIAVVSCDECPIGSICSGGTESATPCPAGSYCATAGLSTPTNVCAKGSFSFAGASACSTCPSAAMKDKDGNVVATTTESTGATSFTACYIDRNAYFADDKGIYHFSQNCTFNANDDHGLDFYESADGTCVNGYVYGEDSDMHVGCFRLPSTEEECSVADYDGGAYWDGKQCVCPGGFTIEYINDLRC